MKAFNRNGSNSGFIEVYTSRNILETDISDFGSRLKFTNAIGINITFSADSVLIAPLGSAIAFHREDTNGTVTFVEGDGATLISDDDALTMGDGCHLVVAVKIAPNTWRLYGNMV